MRGPGRLCKVFGASLLGAMLLAVGTAAAGDNDFDTPSQTASSDCQAAFVKYQRLFKPLYFAISEDGEVCIYSYCQSACRPTSMRQRTLYACERQSKGAPCRIHAYGGSVIPEN